MNDERRTDDLLGHLIDDPDLPKRPEKIATPEAELGEELTKMRRSIEALRWVDGPRLAADFPARLRQKWQGELARSPIAAPSLRRLWLAAAAVALLLTGTGVYFLLTWSPPVVWAEVAEAVRRVPYLHAIAVEDDNGDVRVIEAFFKAPKSWRLHEKGRGLIAFSTERGSGIYSVKDRKWREKSDGYEDVVLPGAIAEKMERGRVLDVALAWVFRGEVPQDQPVPSAVEARTGEMAVFDYVGEPGESWARIWVLRSSRLPIRMKHFRPADNAVTLVSFDYSDPQADSFFDIQIFREESEKIREARELYNVGSRLAGTKPRTAGQLFELRGIRMPRPLEVAVTEKQHVIITTDRPRNRGETGTSLPEGYHEELHDNRGNLYLSYYERATGDRVYQCYVPVPPFVHGKGPPRLQLLYTAWSSHVRKGESFGYDVVLGSQEISLPAPSIPAPPEKWLTAETRGLYERQAMRIYLWRLSLPFERLKGIERLLEEAPEEDQLISAKISALATLGLSEEADRLFEERFKERALADPWTYQWEQKIAGYIARRLDAGDTTEVLHIVERLEERRRAILEGDDKEARRVCELLIQRGSVLLDALAIPRALEAIQKAPPPRVARVRQSRDGYAAVVLATHGRGDPETPGFHQYHRVGASPGWRLLVTRRDRSEAAEDALLQKLCLLRGEGPLTLTLKTRASPSSRAARSPRISVRLPVTLPEPSAETLSDLKAREPGFFADEASTDAERPPFLRALERADRARAEERFDDATAHYRKALAIADEDPLAGPQNPARARQLRAEQRLRASLGVAACLAGLGRLEEAGEEVRAVEKLFSPRVNGDEWLEHRLESGVVARRVEIVRRLLDQGLRAEARRRLEALVAERPDFRGLPDLDTWITTPWGKRGWSRRRGRAQAWAPVDRLLWRMSRRE